MKLDIKASQRWISVGVTGSGKTEFDKYRLRHIAAKMPVAIVDVKGYWLGEHPVWASSKEAGTIDKPHLVTKFEPKWRVQVIQPDIYDKELEKFLLDVLKRKDVYVDIDESEGLCTATQVPLGIRKIWKQGRVLRVGATVGTQTYSGIPKIFKSQAEKRVLFQVGEEDYEDAAKLVHVSKEEVANLGKYEYIYFDTDTMTHGIWMPPLDLEKVKAA